MAQALILLTDQDNEVKIEVKMSPAIDNNSPAHQLVARFVELANLEKVEDATGGQ
jgi:hypothetical protein